MTIAGELLNAAQNPAPQRVHVVLVDTADGATLRAAWWKATRQPCLGTVCILQGRAEFIEKHFEVIRELRRRGFAVVAFDWRGQGRSSRDVKNPKKGHIDDFSSYHLDLAAIDCEILQPLMPRPHFGLAYSMGGTIALDLASRRKLPFKKIVAVSPMLEVGFIRAPRFASFVATLCCSLGLSQAFIPMGEETSISTRPFAGNRLSSDPVRYARSSRTASAMETGAIGAPTIGWTRAAFRIMKRLRRKKVLHAIHVPFVLMTAGDDTICNSLTTERAALHLKNGVAVRIPGSRHEMLLEQDGIRKNFWAAFDAFIPGDRRT